MDCENRDPTGATASITSATVTAGCSENILQTSTAMIGASTFMASKDRKRSEGLLKRYRKSAGATRMPTASTARKMLAVNPKPMSAKTLTPFFLHHCVLPGRFPEPLSAQLRDSLQRVEVDVDQPEPVAETVNPLEIVLRTPEKVPVHRHAFRSRSLELAKAGAQEHHPVGVIHLSVLGDDVRCSAAILGNENRPRAPDLLHMAWRPVHDLRVKDVPRRLHLWMRGIERDVPVAGRLVGRLYVPTGLVDVDADEVERRGDRLQLLLGELGSPAAGLGQIRLGVPPLEHDGREAGVALAGDRLRGPYVLGCVDD